METITIALTMALLQLREPTHPLREAGVAEILLAAFRCSAWSGDRAAADQPDTIGVG